MTALYRATTRPPALPAHTPRPWTQLLEHAYRMHLVTPESRTKFYKMMNARGWKTNEPDIEFIVSEKPCPAGPHRKRVANSGLHR